MKRLVTFSVGMCACMRVDGFDKSNTRVYLHNKFVRIQQQYHENNWIYLCVNLSLSHCMRVYVYSFLLFMWLRAMHLLAVTQRVIRNSLLGICVTERTVKLQCTQYSVYIQR